MFFRDLECLTAWLFNFGPFEFLAIGWSIYQSLAIIIQENILNIYEKTCLAKQYFLQIFLIKGAI